MKSARGFTLIELLIAMTIMVILSFTAIAIYRGATQTARDAKRKSDLDAIHKALAQYKVANGIYPCFATCGWAIASGIVGLTPTYMSQIPNDPSSGTACPGYLYSVSGDAYTLFTQLENANDPSASQVKSIPAVPPPGSSPNGYRTYRVTSGTCANNNYNYWFNSQL